MMKYRIGSFNVKKLSFSTQDEDLPEINTVQSKRDYLTIAKIIRDNFDIVALQEVKTDNVLKIMFPLSSGWEFRWQLSSSKVGKSDEGYAFAWNKNKIRLVTEPDIWKQYRQDPVLGNNGLLRQPFYARFTPSGTLTGGPFCEFRLINTHIRFSPKINQELDYSDTELRKQEFDILVRQILSRLDARRYGNFMPAYTFLLGDYNLNLDTAQVAKNGIPSYLIVMDGTVSKCFLTVQNSLTTLSHKKTIDPASGESKIVFDGFANNYDHFTYNRSLVETRGLNLQASAINTVSLYRNGDFEKHWREISDHIPIVLEIGFE